MPSRLFIKRLELSGFKTFVRRTALTFDPGMTAVIGPNGCGKSNIIDAVRWVLGEQSARQLRAARMEELIFHGSTREKPVGMAEITLTLDNEAGTLRTQGPEISLTRRLYRSGESEYLINRSPVRLKDITDLILDTGVATGAYVIMEQGKIDGILTARASERMALFEEAAGIMRYQQQKEEAERKLAATQSNLVRVGDLVHELKRQLDSLERQARAAEQYQDMKRRALDLRARARAGQLALGQAELAAAEAASAGVHERLEGARAEVLVRQGALREDRERQDAAERDLRAMESELAGLREAAAAFQAQLEDLRGRIHTLDVQQKEREGRLAEVLANREKVSASAAKAGEEAEVDEGRLAQVRRELEEFDRDARVAEEALIKARADLAERRNALGTQADRLHQDRETGTTDAAHGPLAEFRERAPSLAWPLSGLFECAPDRRPAVLAALGPFADAAVVETWEQAHALLSAWREQREAPLTLVVLEALGEEPPRGDLPAGATGWADGLVTCPPRYATLARVLLGGVAVMEDARLPVAGTAAIATLTGIRLSSPGLIWWPGRMPASAKATGTELAMLLAAAVRELGGIEARIVELEADLAEARRFESAARIEHARIEQRLSGRQGERKRLEETAGESGALADRLRTEVESLSADRTRLETELREREAERESERKRQDDLTGRFYARQDELHAQRLRFTALEDELESVRRTAETRQEEVLAAEARLNEARTKFELAKHDFTAEFADRAEQADSLAAQPLSDEELAQLGKLEARLAELGEAVNLLALEEFKDVGERHAEYQKQVEDLRKSRESLQRAIYRLDRTAQHRFEETFETIKAHFHEMFRRLFGGGEADLRLVENEEGERGVEIEAKPPGKRTQSIALLSGGERALTSTALLFALYRTKPSPFCFLDELDAPLDDANTDRFMKILKEFNDQTQFILITHNKHSMELTDSLYGITMEEDGVSKVVSARLRGQAQAVPQTV